MKTNNLLLLLVFILTGLVACKKTEILPSKSISCDYPNYSSHPKAVQLQQLIDDYTRQGLPGISLMIEDSNGVWVGSSGFADIEEGVKFSPCHVSKAASITKLLVGTLTLKLQEEGVLNINDPVSKYIDSDILDKIDGAEGKTLKQLMNHTTGIFDVITSNDFYLAVINNPNKVWHQNDLLEFVYNVDQEGLNNPYPANYSNTNTLLLSMCIEKATDRSHSELLREKILNPIGMNDTYYQGREEIPTDAAQGYFDLHNNGTIVNVSNLITGSGNGYGGVYSNVFDLDKFITALFINKTILSAGSLDLMHEFNQEDEDFYCGVSTVKKFTTKKNYGVGHTGRDLGYSANLFYFPEKGYKLIFFVNYGTNGESNLKPVFKNFESEVVDLLLD